MTPEVIRGPETDAEWAAGQLKAFKGKFDQVLRGFLDNSILEAEGVRPELKGMMEICADFVIEGGKRLRPAFLYFGYKAMGEGIDDMEILKAGIPFELVHAAALVHDDVIDNSDLRRGKPTVHRVFAHQLKSDKTGESLAIVAGDIILALANKAMSAYPVFDERHKRARQLFDRMCVEINYGEHLDVLGNLLGEVSEDWIMKIMEYKTAGYTVEKPLIIGAILGSTSPQTVERLSEYGVKLGIAFQIKDDILGMYGDERKVGKPVDSDLKEGKKTLLVARTLEILRDHGKQEEISRFKFVLGNPNLTESDYKWCQELMRDTGALKYCEGQMNRLTEEARLAVSSLEISPESKRYLLGISDFLLVREY